MKLLIPYTSWPGNFVEYLKRGFEKNGWEVQYSVYHFKKSRLRYLLLNHITEVRNSIINKQRIKYNRQIIADAKRFKPDVVFSHSGSLLLPETIEILKNSLGAKLLCLVSDYPFDPLRDVFFGMTLPKYDFLIVPEKIWIRNIANVAPKASIFSDFYGGYDPDTFYAPKIEEILETDKKKFLCDVSFTGGSYGNSGEGNYRAGILAQLDDWNVKIWGDSGWRFRMKYWPSLNDFYQGERLTYNDLRTLYFLCPINLNMSSPQLFTNFQPRVFEIAAAQGFQLVDYRSDIDNIFAKDELVTFRSFAELNEKIKYYLENPCERQKSIAAVYKRIVPSYSWESQIKNVITWLNDKM